MFCGASVGADERIIVEVKELGRLLASQKIRLIYGGGNVGLMGIIADEVMKNGGEVVGVIPGFLHEKEVAHLDITELIMVDTMHQRKALMSDKCDAVIAMPGGFGTLDELFEMLTWLQLGLHQKPIGLLNMYGFYDFLLKQLDVMVENGFLNPSNRMLLSDAPDAAFLLEKLQATEIVQDEQWFQQRNLL